MTGAKRSVLVAMDRPDSVVIVAGAVVALQHHGPVSKHSSEWPGRPGLPSPASKDVSRSIQPLTVAGTAQTKICYLPRMRKIPWVGFTFALLAWVWVGCGGNAVTGPGTGGSAGSSGTGGSGATAGNGGAGGSAGTVDCNRACAGPPPGCRFDGEPTCDPPTCPPIVCDDAGVDAPADVAWDSSLPDPSAFAGLLNGVWLIGWSGGMNHYSWVRLSSAPNWGGEAEFLTGADLFANIPFWDCSGVGSWMITAKPYTIGLQFPSSCSQGFESYTFLTLQPTTSPSGAVLRASLEDLTNPNALVEGYKFPSNWCVASMTSCPDPWQ